MGHEFTSLILALLQTSGYAPKVSDEVLTQIKELNLSSHFDVFVSLSCHNCPDVVQALNLIAIYNPGTTATMIDGAFFQEEVEAAQNYGCTDGIPRRQPHWSRSYDLGRNCSQIGYQILRAKMQRN